MTEQRNQEDKFAAYLSGKTELSRIYQQSETDGPGELIDQRILSAARQSVKTTAITRKNARRHWLFPVVIAASLAIITITVVLKYQTTPEQHPERGLTSNLKPDPAHLLVEIVELSKQGKKREAAEQLEIFKQLYPDYEFDYQRFPELKHLQNAE